MKSQKIKCDMCGARFYPGNDKYGIPAGVGIELEDGTIINVCKKCVIKANASAKADIKRAIKNARKNNNKEV